MTDVEIVLTEADEPRATIVLVHGAWHGAWCWHDGFAQHLAAAGITTVAPSLRGHAGSAGGIRLNRMRMRDYVDDVVAVVGACEQPPFLAGHSMGGGVVQGFLARHDAPAVAGAALLASMPPRGVVGTTMTVARQDFGAFLAANATWNLGRLVRTPEQVRALFFTEHSPDDIVSEAWTRLQSESYRAFLDMLVLDRPKPRHLDLPLLVLGAGEDPLFPPSDVDATASAWGTEPVMIPRIGHDVMLDAGWERVTEALTSWILAQLGD